MLEAFSTGPRVEFLFPFTELIGRGQGPDVCFQPTRQSLRALCGFSWNAKCQSAQCFVCPQVLEVFWPGQFVSS